MILIIIVECCSARPPVRAARRPCLTPEHRPVITGAGAAPAHLEPVFESMLLQPGNSYRQTNFADGFEPRPGPIRDNA
jgi:hypothetical protein